MLTYISYLANRLIVLGVLATSMPTFPAVRALLNVSHDPTHELYQDFNKSFAASWNLATGEDMKVRQTLAVPGAENSSCLMLETLDGTFGGWAKAQALHFADGSIVDRIHAR